MLMVTLVLIAALVAKYYYKGVNQSADPRVKPARELYGQYNGLAQQNNYAAVFELLDSIQTIYSSFEHYKNSYETGVVWNNRAAIYLTLAVYKDSIPDMGGSEQINRISLDSLLILSEAASIKSIDIYQNWNKRYLNKNAEELPYIINQDFMIGLEDLSQKKQDKFLRSRLKEIEEAQWETQRRLSVAYTNLGLVYRQREDYDNAAKYYTKALELWEYNLPAENNLNRLLGKPIKKRSIIQKLFPREKKKTDKN
jgi:tetratricopeptide (TPR) repeat protein